MSIEQKLQQVERLIAEIREELSASNSTKAAQTPIWLEEGLKKIPMGKSFKTSKLFELISPTESEILKLKIDSKYSGSDEVLFGRLLSEFAGMDIDGVTLHRGMLNGCTTYRAIPTRSV